MKRLKETINHAKCINKTGTEVTSEDDSEYDELLNRSGLLKVEADTLKSMRIFCGKDATIVDIDKDGDYILNIDRGLHCWDEIQLTKKKK